MTREFTLEEPFLPDVVPACALGEGPLYEAETNVLHFVDINNNRVHHLNLDNNTLSADHFEDAVTCLALRTKEKGLACAAKKGFAVIIPPENGLPAKLTYVREPFELTIDPDSRANDGACDAMGRFLAGVMKPAASKQHGKVYQLGLDLHVSLFEDKDITTPNGMGWSADNKTFYLTSTDDQKIYAYDYSLLDGTAKNRRVWLDTTDLGLGGAPDGFCWDSDGGCWGARFNGSKVVRFDRDGKVDVIVHLPKALNPTACELGGPSLSTLFITTASLDESGDQDKAAQYPHSGKLFTLDLEGQFKAGKWRHRFPG